MCSGEVILLLVYGEYAINKLIAIKRAIRANYGLDCNDMKNLIHSADLGNEFFVQFTGLFPDLDPVKYSLYADMNVRLPIDNALQSLLTLERSSNLSWIGVLGYEKQLLKIEKMSKLVSQKINIIFGITRQCLFYNERLSFIGYLPCGVALNKVGLAMEVTAQTFIDRIRECNGITVLNYRVLDDKSEKLLKSLKSIGLDGVVVYDPRFTQNDMARLEYLAADKYQLKLCGGTNGQIAPGMLSIDRTTFEILTDGFFLPSFN